MNTMLRRFALNTTLAAITALACVGASATTLTTKLAVDNGFSAYLSTSDSSVGQLFSVGHDWTTVSTGSVELGTAERYFLQILAYDDADYAGLLGEFSLVGSGYHFADGSTTVLTGSSLLTGNIDGFNGNYSAVTTIDPNNTSQWDSVTGIDADAQWVWARWYDYDNVSYFSLEILADAPADDTADVPEPASLGLLGLGLAALAGVRRKSKSTSK